MCLKRCQPIRKGRPYGLVRRIETASFRCDSPDQRRLSPSIWAREVRVLDTEPLQVHGSKFRIGASRFAKLGLTILLRVSRNASFKCESPAGGEKVPADSHGRASRSCSQNREARLSDEIHLRKGEKVPADPQGKALRACSKHRELRLSGAIHLNRCG